MSTAYHLQTDGQIERQNRVIKEFLKAKVIEGDENWVHLLPELSIALNLRQDSFRKIIPFKGLLGFNPRLVSSEDIFPTAIN